MRTKNYRIHHKARLRKRTEKIVQAWSKNWGTSHESGWAFNTVRRLEKNRKKCSCAMCGNPRKHKEKTLQELRCEEAQKTL